MEERRTPARALTLYELGAAFALCKAKYMANREHPYADSGCPACRATIAQLMDAEKAAPR